jgi:hypothetical protein
VRDVRGATAAVTQATGIEGTCRCRCEWREGSRELQIAIALGSQGAGGPASEEAGQKRVGVRVRRGGKGVTSLLVFLPNTTC